MNKGILEICMTVTLTVANASVIILLLVAWISRIAYEKMHHSQASCCKCKNAGPAQDDGKESAGLELESVNPIKGHAKTAREDKADMTVREAAALVQANAELTDKIDTLTAENDKLKTLQRAKAGAVLTLEAPPTHSVADEQRAKRVVTMKQRRAERKRGRNTARGKRRELGAAS